ncbi:MAG: phosphonate C-P lyase system protein PhnH [Arhodomonas sp.]|nr:phosphonate C-P lyase system protein PhnH [Arhodomonas sp.]
MLRAGPGNTNSAPLPRAAAAFAAHWRQQATSLRVGLEHFLTADRMLAALPRTVHLEEA